MSVSVVRIGKIFSANVTIKFWLVVGVIDSSVAFEIVFVGKFLLADRDGASEDFGGRTAF